MQEVNLYAIYLNVVPLSLRFESVISPVIYI